MSSFCPDLPPTRISDPFERLPDPILLIIFNNIYEVKSLGRLSAVSRRFRSLIPLVESVIVRVDCVLSEEDQSHTHTHKSQNPIAALIRLIFKPFMAILAGRDGTTAAGVSHHSPTQVLKNFTDIRSLRIELPSGELGIEQGVLLKWRAEFGTTLDTCVILGASAVVSNDNEGDYVGADEGGGEDSGSIPESFYTNGGLKLRVVWTISSLIAASARHYLLQGIVSEHKTLGSLVLTDGDGQGVLCMNKEQMEELRGKPLAASSASKRTLVPALNMRLWYAPILKLGDGTVWKGATLVAIRPSEKEGKGEGDWVSGAFEGMFGTAARMLVKRRTYCLEMNSF